MRYWAHYTPSTPSKCDGCDGPAPGKPSKLTGTWLCLDCAGEALAPWRRA